jgi:hypothetical protein
MTDRVSWLKPVNLRDEFKREDKDFTPWLAEEANLREFGGRLGMDLSLEMVEMRDEKSGSGMRSLDILASLPDGTRVAIENQYGEGDHDHLTRGLAYAVNLDCPVLIVVAENHKPEFRAVADYLNRIAENDEDGIAVFLVRFGLLQAPDGSRFPQVEVQAEPNEFRAENQSRIDRATSTKSQELAAFWDRVLPAFKSSPLFSRAQPTGKSAWIGERTAIGSLDWQLRVRAEHCQLLLYASNPSGTYNEELIQALASHADEIEGRFGASLEWDVMEGAKDAKVVHVVDGGYRSASLDVAAIVEAAERFHAAISPALPEIAELADDLSAEDEWDGETYVFTLGESEQRSWHECRQHGFLSAGGGDWYVRTMRQLSQGDRVFACIPKVGYVGVGFVEAPAAHFVDTRVQGDSLPLSNVSLGVDASEETVVPVRWETTVDRVDAIWSEGMRANQNTVWKLQHPFTIEQLQANLGWPSEPVDGV